MNTSDSKDPSLRRQWLVVISPRAQLRDLERPLEETLRELEEAGICFLTSRDSGSDEPKRSAVEMFNKHGVREVVVFDADPPENESQIVLGQGLTSLGTAGALPATLESVFARRNNQKKLAAADTDKTAFVDLPRSRRRRRCPRDVPTSTAGPERSGRRD